MVYIKDSGEHAQINQFFYNFYSCAERQVGGIAEEEVFVELE